ncbi:MAG: HAMP domain-containing sensor histidine kinase [Pseudomonadota bacterium]
MLSDHIQLSLNTDEDIYRWVVSDEKRVEGKEDTPSIFRENEYSRPDHVWRGQRWKPVSDSLRCPRERPYKQRVRFALCPESENKNSLCAALKSNSPRDISFSISVHSKDKGVTASSSEANGIRRGSVINALSSLADRGERIEIVEANPEGCDESSVDCDCQKGNQLWISEDKREVTSSKADIYTNLDSDIRSFLPDSLLTRLTKSAIEQSVFCDDHISSSKYSTAIRVLYYRDPAMNAVLVQSLLQHVLPLSIFVSLLAFFSIVFILLRLGYPLARLTVRLEKRRKYLAKQPKDGPRPIPYLGSKTEIGSLAKIFDDLLNKVNEQADRVMREAVQERQVNSIVAHEIKAPLHKLLTQKEYARSVEIQRIDAALDAIERMESATEDERSTIIRAGELVEQFVDARDYKNMKVKINSDCEIKVRGQLLALTLENLTSNADRFRASEDSEIVYEILSTEKNCCISVRNDGPAIPSDRLETIFNLRYTHSEGARDHGKRKGIGLFISRYYIRLLGGSLEAVDTDQGAILQISLPRYRSSQE